MTSSSARLRHPVGVSHREDSATPAESASEVRRPYDLAGELADLVERIAIRRQGTKRLAGDLDVAYSTVRDWAARPERLPAIHLPDLLRLADPADPFLPRFAHALGYRLVLLEPAPEQVAGLLVEAGCVPAKKRAAVVSILRGVRRDSRQASLWGEP